MDITDTHDLWAYGMPKKGLEELHPGIVEVIYTIDKIKPHDDSPNPNCTHDGLLIAMKKGNSTIYNSKLMDYAQKQIKK